MEVVFQHEQEILHQQVHHKEILAELQMLINIQVQEAEAERLVLAEMAEEELLEELSLVAQEALDTVHK